MARKKVTPGLAVLGLRTRSQLYLKSAACTSRFTGGWNITPLRSVKVQVRPSLLIFGGAVAISGTSAVVPGLYAMSPLKTLCKRLKLVQAYEMAGSKSPRSACAVTVRVQP